jgi:Outer membrane protein beta-barrel domain
VKAAALIAGCGWMPIPAAAQEIEAGASLGLGVPGHEAAELRGIGPHLSGYVGYGIGPVLQLRGEAAFTLLTGDGATDGQPAETRGDLRIGSVGATLVYSPFGDGSGVYGLAGAGFYALRNSQAEVRTVNVPGLQLGIGTNVEIGPAVDGFAEARLVVPFTDFGTGSEFSPLTYFPVAVGLRIPLRR